MKTFGWIVFWFNVVAALLNFGLVVTGISMLPMLGIAAGCVSTFFAWFMWNHLKELS